MTPKNEKKNPNTSHHTQCFKEGSFVEVSSVKDGYNGAWYGAKIIQLVTPYNTRNINPTFLVEYQTLLCEDGSKFLIENVDIDFIRPAPLAPEEFERVFEVGDVVDAFQLDGWWVGVVVAVMEEEDGNRKYCVFFEDPPDFADLSASDLRVHLDWVSGNWVRPPKREDCEEKLKLKPTIPNTPVASSPTEGLGAINKIKEAMKSTPHNAMVACRGNGLAQNTPESDVTTSHPAKKARTRRTAGKHSVFHIHKRPGEMDQSIGNVSSEPSKIKESRNSSRRKRGKPSKNLRRGCSIILGLEKVGGSAEATSQRKRGRPAKTLCRGLEETRSDVCNMDSVDDPTPIELDQPIITKLPLITEGNSAEVSPTILAHDGSNEGSREPPETPKRTASKTTTSNGLLEPDYNLPFTKESSVWKLLEDMEVFQKMPQKPHFRPLYEMGELLREGFAVARMVNFANLVTRLSESHYKDPKSVSELIDDLEKNGFDVEAIKERIDEVELMKARGKKLQEESQRIERQIMECAIKKTEVSLEYDRIAQEKRELIAREEKIMSVMGETDSMFTSLISRADAISTEMKRVERGLDVLASFPW